MAALGLDDDPDRRRAASRFLADPKRLQPTVSAPVLGELILILLRQDPRRVAEHMNRIGKWVESGKLETFGFGETGSTASENAEDLRKRDAAVGPADALIIGAAIADPGSKILFAWDEFTEFREVADLAGRHGKRIEELPSGA